MNSFRAISCLSIIPSPFRARIAGPERYLMATDGSGR
jgi:hypothetical protein